MVQQTDEELAKILWDYNLLKQPLKKADCILALGSIDLRVAQRAAELYLQGFASLIIFSGNEGEVTKGLFKEPEAVVFAKEAIKMGVPQKNIILEDKSTNTGENIVLTRKLIQEKGLDLKSFIVVQKPWMLRRTYATIKKQWPEMDFVVTAPEIPFEDYPYKLISMDFMINTIVGDTQRVKIYGQKCFQIRQQISKKVWGAFEELVKRGYTKHLL